MYNHSYSLFLADTTDTWSNLLTGFDADKRLALVIVVILAATGIIISAVAIVASTAKSVRIRLVETDMKRELLDRGLRVDEVVRVIEATSAPGEYSGGRRDSGERA